MKLSKKQWILHGSAIIFLFLLVVIYFKPVVLENKALPQGDMLSAQGMAKEVQDFQKETGEYSGWTNSMFAGMPSIVVQSYPAFNVFSAGQLLGRLGLDYSSAGIVMISLLAAYLALLCLGLSIPLALLGSIALSLVSYNFIIIDAGHVTKGYAIACMILSVAGMLICLKGKMWGGALLTLIGTGMLIAANHVQISYYTALILLIMWIVYALYAFRRHEIASFFKRTALLLVIAIGAILPSSTLLFPIMEYSKDTMRGGQVLEQKDSSQKESTGLDIDYAYSWSYGKAESFTLLIPSLYGGSSHEQLSKDSPLSSRYGLQMAPTYWGEQPFTSGPVYAGAIICFLFILGLWIVKGPERWWITIAVLLGLILAWGKNLIGINEFLFHYLPLYSKFRTPAMALVIVNLLMPLMGVLALKQIFSSQNPMQDYRKPVFYSGLITAGICLFFALLGPVLMSFTSSADAATAQWPADAIESLRNTRISMLKADAWRSFLLVAIGLCLLWCFLSKKLKATPVALALAIIVLLDLWTVDKRYLNDAKFQRKQDTTIQATEIDLAILQDKDPNFRVFNAASNTFNESVTSYFHKSVGGYSPAKLRRYQDIIDYHFSKKLNFRVLNMLNTKYFIVPESAGGGIQRNEGALGNAWFVDSLCWVNSPNEEIEALYQFDPSRTAIVHQEFKKIIPSSLDLSLDLDSSKTNTPTIRLTSYAPNHLQYQSSSSKDHLAVFSEIYYPKEWKAYIDGKEVPHFRTNYILRSMIIPSGEHQIEFKHTPYHYQLWCSISNISSLVILILLGVAIFIRKFKTRTQ